MGDFVVGVAVKVVEWEVRHLRLLVVAVANCCSRWHLEWDFLLVLRRYQIVWEQVRGRQKEQRVIEKYDGRQLVNEKQLESGVVVR